MKEKFDINYLVVQISQTNCVLKQLHLASDINDVVLWKLWNFCKLGVVAVFGFDPCTPTLTTEFSTRLWVEADETRLAVTLLASLRDLPTAAELKFLSKLCDVVICEVAIWCDRRSCGSEFASALATVLEIDWCFWVFVSTRWDEALDFFDDEMAIRFFRLLLVLNDDTLSDEWVFLLSFSYTNIFSLEHFS